jgi:UV DNA damage endonuclease
MIRWGLCCQFVDADIKFRSATHRYVAGLPAGERREYLAQIAWDNAEALTQAVAECRRLGIGAFRINSQVLPLATHPVSGYTLGDLDDHVGLLEDAFAHVRPLAHELGVRLSFHPDQFVVLNSERPSVLEASVRELEMQAVVSELVGADTITLHVGGATGGCEAAIDRLKRGIDRLSPRARARLAFENDDRLFAPADLLPLCADMGVALVYDSHHHRCHPDALSVEEASLRAAETWRGRDAALGPFAREPYFHVSSPRDGWDARNPRPHADRVDPADVPRVWTLMDLTVDVEAKEKERAVLALMTALGDAPPSDAPDDRTPDDRAPDGGAGPVARAA